MTRTRHLNKRAGQAVIFLLAMISSAAGCTLESPSERIVRPGEQTSSTESESPRNEQRQPQRSSPPAGEARETVAVVNGESISVHEFERMMTLLPEYARVRFRTVQAQQSLLTSVIHTEAMADIAERRGLGASTEARYAMQHELARQALEQAVDAQLSMQAIEDEEIRAYFDKHRDEFWQPERRRLAVAVTGTESRARTLRREFTDNHPVPSAAHQRPDEAARQRMNTFRRLAASRSVHRQLPARGGDPGLLFPPDRVRSDPPDTDLIGSPDLRRTFSEVAFGLDETGELSDVFACDAGEAPHRPETDRWCLAMLLEIVPPEEPPLEEVSREIRSKLYNQRVEKLRQSLLQKWRDEAKITVRDGWVDDAQPPSKPPRSADELPLETVPVAQYEQSDSQ